MHHKYFYVPSKCKENFDKYNWNNVSKKMTYPAFKQDRESDFANHIDLNNQYCRYLVVRLFLKRNIVTYQPER